MKLTVSAVLVAFVAMSLFVFPVDGAPKPNSVSLTWEMEIQVGKLTPIAVRTPGSDESKIYWFAHYKLTNRTGKERTFVPDFELYTNTGQVVRAGVGVPLTVFKAIKKNLNAPLLRDQTAMTGKVLQGRDNTKQGVAIFTDIDVHAGKVDLFISGLSGETVTVNLPMPIKVPRLDDDGKATSVEITKIVLSKTKRIRHIVSGNLANRTGLSARQYKKSDWIMR